MTIASESAKKAFENAISTVKANSKKLEEFACQTISTDQEFIEFADRVGDINIAKSYCIIKYGQRSHELFKNIK